MSQHNIVSCLCQLSVTVVVSIVAGQAERIALFHLNVSEGFEGVGLLIEVCAVTEEVGSLVAEVYIAVQHLCVAVLILVVVQTV